MSCWQRRSATPPSSLARGSETPCNAPRERPARALRARARRPAGRAAPSAPARAASGIPPCKSATAPCRAACKAANAPLGSMARGPPVPIGEAAQVHGRRSLRVSSRNTSSRSGFSVCRSVMTAPCARSASTTSAIASSRRCSCSTSSVALVVA